MNTFLVVIMTYIMSIGVDEENYYGEYYNSQNEKVVEFTLSQNGIEELVLDGRLIKSEFVKYDYLGYFGSTLFLKILTKEEGIQTELKVLLESQEGLFLQCVGLMITSKIENNQYELISSESIVFKKKGYPPPIARICYPC